MCIIAAPAAAGAAAATSSAATTAAIVSAAATVAATAYAGYSQHQMGKYQAQVAKNNAVVQEQLAQDALKRGAEAERRHRVRVDQIKGQQRAGFAASGVVVDSGSALDTLEDTAELGELDALTIRADAEREAHGYRVGASNSMAQSKLYLSSGNNALAGSILSSGGAVADKWYSHKMATG